MIMLGIETSSRICSVALVDGEGLRDEISLDIGLVHSEKLIPLIDSLLKKNRIPVKKLEGIGVSIGPGSFTGIRVGVSAARGLAQSLKIPLMGVSSLDGLAANTLGMKNIPVDGFICPVIDALRGEVYTAVYRVESGRIKRLSEYSLVAIEALLNSLKSKKRVLFLGDAVDLHSALIKSSNKGSVIVAKKTRYASALSIAVSCNSRKAGKMKDYNKILPLYIRKPEAEVKWRERNEKIKTGIAKG